MHRSTQRHTRGLGVNKGNRDTSEEKERQENVWNKEDGRAGIRKKFRMESRASLGLLIYTVVRSAPLPPLSLLTSLKGLGMAESISTLMKESSPSAERLELSAEAVWEMTRLVSLFFLLSDSSFLFCWADGKKRGSLAPSII